jgi:hypothetical protein
MRLAAAAALCAPLLALPARAADPFTDAVAQAHPPYRVALFRSVAGPPEAARAAIDQAAAAWDSVEARFRIMLPVPYAGDADWPATRDAVRRAFAEARAAAALGDLPAAQEALEMVREHLGEMRRRNGVVAYSDHVNLYRAEMERALERLEQGAPVEELREAAGVLVFLAARLESEAPPGTREAPLFRDAVAGLRAATERSRDAARAGEPAALAAAGRALNPAFARLFVNFG